ncbi:MAG: CBS domain-containing protein [Minicystis sp.]
MSTIARILERKDSSIHSISADASLHQAAVVMTRNRVGSLLVRSAEGNVGLLSERDIVQRLALATSDAYDTPVWQAMHEICEVDSDQDIHHAMELMTDRRVRHLVVRHDGDVIGLVSIGDLVKACIDDQEGAILSLSHYITGVPD